MKKKKLKCVTIKGDINPDAKKLFKALQKYYTLNKQGKMIDSLIFECAIEVGGILEPVGLTPIQKKGFQVCQEFAQQFAREAAAKRVCEDVTSIPMKKQGLYLSIIAEAIAKGDQCLTSPQKEQTS